MPIKALLRGDSIDLSILAELYPEPSDPVVTADRSGYYLTSPTLPDSLAQWGLFNAVFERKEYMEAYVAEEVARKMLADDPTLRATFDGPQPRR